MRARRQDLMDGLLAGAVMVAGGASLAFALLHHWTPGDMNAGVDGSLTVGVLAPALARLQGLPYRTTVVVTAAILALQLAAFQAVHMPVFGVLGLELLALGLIGLGSALAATSRAPRPVKENAKEKAKARRADVTVAETGAPHLAHF